MNAETKTIVLNSPIKTNDKPITEFTIRKPMAGELRGVKLFNMMQGDSGDYIEVLPRVTSPALTKAQASSLDLADLLQVMETVGGWFVEDRAYPNDVMQAWVDINIVFGGGWQPSQMESMSMEELTDWWNLAHEQNKREQKAAK